LLDTEALSLFATITHLEQNSKPWENVAVAVYFVQEEDKKLPCHADYLTRIEAPHYRTLKKESTPISETKYIYTLDDLLNSSDRIINIYDLPESHAHTAIKLAEQYENSIFSINNKDGYVHMNTDDIFIYMTYAKR
jgi:hypothetical protein